jgi:hypothetical protein
MRAHPSFCDLHNVDSDGTQSCTSVVEVGEWDAVLVINDEAVQIWPEHPSIIRVEDEATLTPQQAIELGRALILQGMRGLEVERRGPAEITGSDEVSASVHLHLQEVAQ